MTSTATDKIALITGAGRGLGRSTALHLARAGVGVVGTHVAAKDAADSLVEEVQAAGGTARVLPGRCLHLRQAASFQGREAQVQGAEQLGATTARETTQNPDGDLRQGVDLLGPARTDPVSMTSWLLGCRPRVSAAER